MKLLLNQSSSLSDASSEAALSGKIMHIKTYMEREPQTRRLIDAQIRCYFAYKTTTTNKISGAAFSTQQEWNEFVLEVMGDMVVGPVTFMRMLPQGGSALAGGNKK